MCLLERMHPEHFDYIPFWRHNGYGLFDVPEVIESVASALDIDVSCPTSSTTRFTN